MPALIVLGLVLAVAVLVMVVFIMVVLGIHSEQRYQMTTQAQGPLAAMVRRLLGVNVIRPDNTQPENDDREECLSGNSTDWWNNGRLG
jgi:hypothetical protein